MKMIIGARTHVAVAPSGRCPASRPGATALDQIAKHGGRVQNFSGNAELAFDTNGSATLHPVGTDIAFANLTYRLTKDDNPHRITLQAAHPTTKRNSVRHLVSI